MPELVMLRLNAFQHKSNHRAGGLCKPSHLSALAYLEETPLLRLRAENHSNLWETQCNVSTHRGGGETRPRGVSTAICKKRCGGVSVSKA